MSTTTTNMGLIIPANGETDYPTSIQSSFSSIDTHDHSTGKGKQIITGGIADLAVTTAKLADNSVTQAKRASLGQQISSDCGLFDTNSTSLTDVTNLSVTITTTGRPVFVGLISSATGPTFGTSSALLAFDASGSATSVSALFAILEDATVISFQTLRADAVLSGTTLLTSVPSSALWTIRSVAAGTYTYKVQAARIAGTLATTNSSIYNSKLIAYEL
jgi:hypothetical protein